MALTAPPAVWGKQTSQAAYPHRSPSLRAHTSATTRHARVRHPTVPRSVLEQQRVLEYLSALEQALEMGTIDEAEFEEVGSCAALLEGFQWKVGWRGWQQVQAVGPRSSTRCAAQLRRCMP